MELFIMKASDVKIQGRYTSGKASRYHAEGSVLMPTIAGKVKEGGTIIVGVSGETVMMHQTKCGRPTDAFVDVDSLVEVK